MRSIVLLVLTLFIFTACAPIPQNATEFRKAALESSFAEKKEFTVKRPWHKVAQTFARNAKKCLQKSIVTTTRYNNGAVSRMVSHYNPTVVHKKKRVELHLQRDMENAVTLGGKPPKKGMFVFVVDAYPLKKDRTKIDMYKPDAFGAYEQITKAITLWAKGKTNACPDLTQ